jgi:hypothetical protein
VIFWQCCIVRRGDVTANSVFRRQDHENGLIVGATLKGKDVLVKQYLPGKKAREVRYLQATLLLVMQVDFTYRNFCAIWKLGMPYGM